MGASLTSMSTSSPNEPGGFHESPYEPRPPSAMKSEDEIEAAPDGSHDDLALEEGRYTFELPDAECFYALAMMAGNIAAAEQDDKKVQVNQHLREINHGSSKIYESFLAQDLPAAAEFTAKVVCNALAIAAVVEANFPGSFAGPMERFFQTLKNESAS